MSLNEIKYVVNINVFIFDEFDFVLLGCWLCVVMIVVILGKIVFCLFVFLEKFVCI